MTRDDETEGFLTPARADAIAANLVGVGYVEVGHGKMQVSKHEPFRTDVTSENWPELKAIGWQWAADLPWPLDREEYLYHGRAILDGIKSRHGEANVLLGSPWSRSLQRPVDRAEDDQIRVGVYVLENLQLPESVRKFIAEHEEKP